MIRYLIIGCGLIGEKRATALKYIKGAKLAGCFDINDSSAINFSKKFNCERYTSIDQIKKSHKNFDATIICTNHSSLPELSQVSINLEKHTFTEKPGARSYKELMQIKKLLSKKKVNFRLGYNHRYHPSIAKAVSIFKEGKIGDLMYIRGRYGHGGRLGYEKEWRFNKKISGGGELIDQGPHLIDLALIFLGNISKVNASLKSYFWETELEDNAFLLLESNTGQTASLHLSCTEWKNKFSFEIFGKSGKLEVSGLGKSYGIEKLTHYKMGKKMGPPQTQSWEFPFEDNSWELELKDFHKDIQGKVPSSIGIDQGLEILKVIDNCYKIGIT